MIDLDNFDQFFENNTFLSKDFIQKVKEQKCEVKKQFVDSFAKQFSLVTREELNCYEKKIKIMTQKINELEETITANKKV